MMETNNEEMVLDAFRKAGKPLRPGDVAKLTGLDSKEVSKEAQGRRQTRDSEEMLLLSALM